MKGIILINPRYSINDLNLSDSFAIQKVLTEKFMTNQKISQVTLNPNQIYPYYTIPHVLLHHLQKEKCIAHWTILFYIPLTQWNVS